ncbi:MAG: hypothetical protein ISR58_11570 [Anaerolineales bacterium]|nr:hypothetical protein [Chloroflexota bacterium]MBL6981814.1 hypothetical protein [Anaerolineales bacterium]
MATKLGRIAGLEVRARTSSLIAFIIIYLLLGLIAIFVIRLPLSSAITGAFMATLLHFASELWHNLGHAVAARSTGYPMNGILFIGPLAMSRYPKDEPELPAKVHIRRALGGPLSSLLLTLILAIFVWNFSPDLGTTWWVILFLLLDNSLVFSFGALLPLGFTDGSTVLYWLKNVNNGQ